VENQHSKDWKTRMTRRIEALRMLAAGHSPTDVAGKFYKGHEENLRRDLKEFRSVDYPAMCAYVNMVITEKLLEKGGTTWLEKAKQSKIRRAEQGLFMGTRPTGYRILDGRLIQIKGEISRVDRVLYGFRVLGKTADQLADEFKFPLSTVHRILRNPVYKGEFVFLGKSYKGNWKPRITMEEYDEIQSMLHAPTGGSRLSKVLYRWKDGKWVARPGAKELASKIVQKRLEQKSGATIAGELEISRSVVDKVLKDRRVTGDSDFEQLVPRQIWDEAQKKHVPTFQEFEEERSRQRKQQIMSQLPAYRWEIREKLGLSKIVVNSLIEDLKEDMIQERADGLLARAWEIFPEKVLAKRHKGATKAVKKVLEVLQSEGKMTRGDLIKKTGFSEPYIQMLLTRMRRMGVIERQDYWGYGIRDEWVKHVANWLSQPHIAKL